MKKVTFNSREIELSDNDIFYLVEYLHSNRKSAFRSWWEAAFVDLDFGVQIEQIIAETREGMALLFRITGVDPQNWLTDLERELELQSRQISN